MNSTIVHRHKDGDDYWSIATADPKMVDPFISSLIVNGMTLGGEDRRTLLSLISEGMFSTANQLYVEMTGESFEVLELDEHPFLLPEDVIASAKTALSKMG